MIGCRWTPGVAQPQGSEGTATGLGPGSGAREAVRTWDRSGLGQRLVGWPQVTLEAVTALAQQSVLELFREVWEGGDVLGRCPQMVGSSWLGLRAVQTRPEQGRGQAAFQGDKASPDDRVNPPAEGQTVLGS